VLEKTGGGKLDLELERRIATLVDTTTIEEYRKKQRQLTELRLLQYERKQQLEAIGDRLRGHKAADIRALGLRNQELEQSIERIQGAIKDNEWRAKVAGTKQQSLARQLDKLPGAKPE